MTIYPQIKELKKSVIEDQISSAITSAYAIRKVGTITAEELDEMAMAITNDIQDYFKGFRLQEIVHAIQDGAKGLYERDGDLTTVSVELILKWIRRYAETVRKEALHKQKEYEAKQAEKHTEEKRIAGELDLKKEINRVYYEFLCGKKLFECVNSEFYVSILANQFVFIEKNTRIDLTESMYLSCGERAKKEIESKKPRRDVKAEFDLFSRTKDNQMLNLARYYALEMQFELYVMDHRIEVFNINTSTNESNT